MRKDKLFKELQKGTALKNLLRVVPGVDCEIAKAEKFTPGDDVIYIPDLWINGIPVHRQMSDEEIKSCMENCYTGNDFIRIGFGNHKIAEQLFIRCTWQHPETELPIPANN